MAFIQKEMKKILSNQNLSSDEKEKQLTELAKKVGANGLYYAGGGNICPVMVIYS
jgi:hypothetical protein